MWNDYNVENRQRISDAYWVDNWKGKGLWKSIGFFCKLFKNDSVPKQKLVEICLIVLRSTLDAIYILKYIFVTLVYLYLLIYL